MIPGVEKSQVTFSFIHAYLAILMKHARLAILLTALSAPCIASVTLAPYACNAPAVFDGCTIGHGAVSKIAWKRLSPSTAKQALPPLRRQV